MEPVLVLGQEKRILYIQLDLDKTYVTKKYGTTNIKIRKNVNVYNVTVVGTCNDNSV
jgi:hypothetical protein